MELSRPVFLVKMKIAGPAASERNAALKKLWKYRHFRLAASGIILTLLGLSFSLAGRGTAGTGPLTGTYSDAAASPSSTDTGAEPDGQSEECRPGPAPQESAWSGETVSGTEQTALHVFVCGSVRRPDVYMLPEGSRITDAVRAAGGFSEDAARDALNLAELLSDGEKVRIPSMEEWKTAEAQTSPGEAENASRTAAPRDGGRISLNTAGQKELMTLPGIGESRAARIIAWREQHGPFRSTEDLMKVPGIKQATYNELKDRITAD